MSRWDWPPCASIVENGNNGVQVTKVRGAGSGSEAFRCAGPGLCRFLFTVPGRCRCFQRSQQPSADAGYLVNSAFERSFIGSRRLVEARNLAYKLERGRTNLLIGHRRIKIEKRLDVPAHTSFPLSSRRSRLRPQTASTREARVSNKNQ